MGNTSVEAFDSAITTLQNTVKETAVVSLRAHASLLVAATQRFLAVKRLENIHYHFGSLITKTDTSLNVSSQSCFENKLLVVVSSKN